MRSRGRERGCLGEGEVSLAVFLSINIINADCFCNMMLAVSLNLHQPIHSAFPELNLPRAKFPRCTTASNAML
jgi:hypothetical protein